MKHVLGRMVLALFFLWMPADLSAQGDAKNYTCQFYEAYISGDMTSWPEWLEALEMKYEKRSDPEILYDILIAYYGYVAWLIGVDEDDRADRFLEEAQPYLDELDGYEGYSTYAESFRGAFLAFEIGMSKRKAVFLGPESISHINRAVELDPGNPVAWMEKGNAEYHMPRIFGGSYRQAASYFKKSVRFFEDQPGDLSCNWRYLNALAWLAQSYDKAGMEEEAAQTYRKIMEVEPRFSWVREELVPEF